MRDELDVFVPGRLCLFGEHSDWAGGYRRENPALTPGYCIAVGTEQGIRARVCRNNGEFVARSLRPDTGTVETVRAPMAIEPLVRIAREGGFWSYAAGTAAEALRDHDCGGVTIDCYAMDLPLRKGLSSSAAICTLTARALNQLYGLGLSVRGEMELAYRGEVATPSRCGRMDQICAYGSIPCFLTFDGDGMEVEPLSVGGLFYYLIVDLNGEKDTVRILADLNACYPNAPGPIARSVRDALGTENREIVGVARHALIQGNALALGALMRRAQLVFDRQVAPACPQQLEAPLLHQALALPALQPLILGAKGVGSQGDGTAQFLTKGPQEQDEARDILKRMLGMNSYHLTLAPQQS